MFSLSFFRAFFVVLIGAFFCVNTVEAVKPKLTIRDEAYSAAYVSQSVPDPVVMKPGEKKTVVFTFKNTGTVSWNGNGSNFISAFTVEPKYRTSIFRGVDWANGDETGRMKGIVHPGETGEIAITFVAPKEPGLYREEFFLAAQNYSWVKNGYFFADIRVVDGAVSSSISIAAPTTTAFAGKQVFLNKKRVRSVGGEMIPVIVGIKNTGTEVWHGADLHFVGGVGSSANASFADTSWISGSTVSSTSADILPGKVFRFKVVLRAPALRGIYTAKLQAVSGEKTLLASPVSIFVETVADAPEDYTAPVFSSAISGVAVPRLAEEPMIRVGLFVPDSVQFSFVSNEDSYVIWTSSSTAAGVLPMGEKAMLSYVGGVYSMQAGAEVFESREFIRLTPQTNKAAVFVLPDVSRTISGRGKTVYNEYRGTVEWRRADDTKKVYIINELPLEYYVKGIAETGNNSPMEYQKALLTAARTYAYFTAEHTGKHSKRHFDVVAHTGDQLYLGYVSEKAMPKVVEAAEATRGAMVSYNGEVVITPYFGNTDGRTRSWKEVWGGADKPWLQSVPALYDMRDKKKMFGHGVGMSARDAAYMAEDGGALWEDILRYYYTGVSIEQMYL